MLGRLIPIALVMLAAVTCGMTSKKVTDMDSAPAPHHTDCCREASMQSDRPFAFPPDAKVDRHRSTGVVVSLKGKNLGLSVEKLDCFRDLMAGQHLAGAALCFMEAFRSEFKLDHPTQELSPIGVHTDELKMTRVRLRQEYTGLNVWPCEISIYISAQNRIYWVKGNTIPTPRGLDTGATLSASEAIGAVSRDMGIDIASCNEYPTELFIYAGQPQRPVLAYRVSAGSGLADVWDFVVDAHTGKILKKFSRVRTRIGS
ncbi:MAG: hypothetical protein CSA23_05935 [Deltaproteobacteria bacterium]|nr:MAG: hypothetical protein CSA23_05935 [Deltaproteobacteria bacterium]